MMAGWRSFLDDRTLLERLPLGRGAEGEAKLVGGREGDNFPRVLLRPKPRDVAPDLPEATSSCCR